VKHTRVFKDILPHF